MPDEPGEMVDADSGKMLEELTEESPEVRRKMSLLAIERAIAEDGMNPEEAERIYGLPTDGQRDQD